MYHPVMKKSIFLHWHPPNFYYLTRFTSKSQRPSTTSQVNDYNIFFPRYEKGKVNAERGVYDTNNQWKKENFKYDQEEQFCIRVTKVESKEDGTITGKRCPVFNYTGKKIVTIDALQKRNPKWIRKNREAYFVVVNIYGNYPFYININ